jgi:hypothetical protein
MACHYLSLKDSNEFYSLLKSRDPDLIVKMVKCVISAFKRNKESIDIFDITFKNLDSLVFTIEKNQYKELLSNCLDDLIKIDEPEHYLLCAEIKKILEKKQKTKKEKVAE